MKWDETSAQICSVARATSIFGDRWTLLILRQLFMRLTKFSDIQKALGITKHRLTDRLNRLIEEEIVFKHLYDESYKRYEYRLTEKGKDLYAVFIVIGQWGDKWMGDADGPPVEYVHKASGKQVDPILSCARSGEPLTPHNVKMQLGPGVKKKLERNEIDEQQMKLYASFLNSSEAKDG